MVSLGRRANRQLRVPVLALMLGLLAAYFAVSLAGPGAVVGARSAPHAGGASPLAPPSRGVVAPRSNDLGSLRGEEHRRAVDERVRQAKARR